MDIEQWKQLKRTGGYRRSVKKVYERMKNANITNIERGSVREPTENDIIPMLVCHHKSPMESTYNNSEKIKSQRGFYTSCFDSDGRCDLTEADKNDEDDEQSYEYFKENEKKCDFRNKLRSWALKHKISHSALKDLLQILNDTSVHTLPNDLRTILKTPRTITTTTVGSGEYWHNGLKTSLISNLEKTSEIPECISISVNIIGLPVYNSSKQQFWPILCSISEQPNIQPIICGIYLGTEKPKDLETYLLPFVDEMNDILQNGIEIKSKKVEVTFKCFVCDSPARAMIKGVCNYNGKHGCLKCTVVGEYSHVSHTVIFPGTDCTLRNDKDFREKKYGIHHKMDTPLLRLPINMVEDFPVADSLHLIDLGVMKRLLIGWRDGSFGKKDTKWRASDIQTVNDFLNSCKTPAEIHRSVRGLDNLGHWKGSEYRTFFYYLSIVILPNVLKQEAFKHFLALFCAITICSSEEHFRFLPLAKELLKHFVQHYKDFYGVDYITSNVHNLTHVVDEVYRFGNLQTFNAYKFENKLYLIKNLLRQGNKPLAQVAKRLSEYEYNDDEYYQPRKTYPYVKKNLKNQKLGLYFQDFVLSTKSQDNFFLTSRNEIMEVHRIKVKENQINIYCKKIHSLQNVFDLPVNSSYLNIYKSRSDLEFRTECLCLPSDVKCKLVVTNHESELIFIPLLHTL